MSEDANRRVIAQELLTWIALAREIVADHFPAERTEPHNQLVIETARALMEADRLRRIEALLAGLAATLAGNKPT